MQENENTLVVVQSSVVKPSVPVKNNIGSQTKTKNTVMVIRYYVVNPFLFFRAGLYATGSRRGQKLNGVLDNEISCLCHISHNM